MATLFQSQVLVDTTKRTVIKIVGGLGGVDDTGNLVVNSANLLGFKGLNGNVGLYSIRTIQYSVSSNASVRLYWYGSNANSNIAVLSGTGCFPVPGAAGFSIIPDANGATGNLWVATSGFNNAGAGYTVVIDISKNAQYYDPAALTQQHSTVDLELDEAQTKFVTRVRAGKVLRRVRVRSVKRRGYKLSGNRVIREKPQEARNRRRGAMKAARKRRSHRGQINRKRLRSMLKRSRLHIKKGR